LRFSVSLSPWRILNGLAAYFIHAYTLLWALSVACAVPFIAHSKEIISQAWRRFPSRCFFLDSHRDNGLVWPCKSRTQSWRKVFAFRRRFRCTFVSGFLDKCFSDISTVEYFSRAAEHRALVSRLLTRFHSHWTSGIPRYPSQCLFRALKLCYLEDMKPG
jgi:hypothetical protein